MDPETCQRWLCWLGGLRALLFGSTRCLELRQLWCRGLGQGHVSFVGTDCRCQSMWKMAVPAFASSLFGGWSLDGTIL